MNKRDYSPAMRARLAAALREVLPMVWDGTKEGDKMSAFRHPCSAALIAGYRGTLPKAHATALQEELRARIAPHRCLEDWLHSVHGFREVLDHEAVQAHRIWWLETMLEEFER